MQRIVRRCRDHAFPLWVRTVIALIAVYGMFLTDILRLERRAVQSDAHGVKIPRQNKRQFVVGFVAALIREQLAASTGRWLFPHSDYPRRPATPCMVRDANRRYAFSAENLARLRYTAELRIIETVDVPAAVTFFGIHPATAERLSRVAVQAQHADYIRLLLQDHSKISK